MKRLKRFAWGKAAAAAIAAAACLQLAACGKGSENTTAQKEFAYVPEYQKISGAMDGINNVNVVDDMIYFTGGEYDETAQSYMNFLYALKIGDKEPVKMPLDLGPDSNILQMNTVPDGSLQILVQTYMYEDAEENGTDDGKEAPEEETGEPEPEENDTDTADAKEEASDVEEASSSIGMPGTDEDYMAPSSQKTELIKLSTDGTVISAVDISDSLGGDVYIQYMEIDKDGNTYAAYDQTIYVLDKEGKKLFEIEVGSWILNMFSAKDGTILVSYYGQENMEVHPIDFAQKKLAEAEKNLIVSPFGNYVFVKGSDTDILYSAENSLYTYNFGDEAPAEILNWIDCDINSDDLRSFAALPDGRILAVTSYWENDTNTMELVYLTKKKGSEVPEKKILTYGTLYLSYDIRKQIIDFNKTNQEYRVEVKEYIQDSSTTEGYNEGRNQLNIEIVGGNGPDIIDLSSGSMAQYMEKGVIEDLYPYLDKDPELNKEDYLPNILKAFEVDGKLCAVSPRFYISTILAKVSDVGERESITLDEVMELMDKLPEGTDLYQYSTKDSILSNNIMMNLDEYIDWSTGECTFNSDAFIKALEFSNQFDLEFNYEEDRPGTASRLHDGSLLMLNASINSVQDYQMYAGMFGEPVAFVGFPTNKKVGSTVGNAGSMLGMNSKSRYKDGVWQFIRMGITKEAQENPDVQGWGMPIMKSALEAQFQKDMEKEYYEDENGKKVEQPKTTWGYDDFSIDIYAATEEEVEAVRKLIDSVDTLYQYDEQIMNMISEETAAFFEGQKNAKDVAEIVQSRIQIYVNENR